MRGDRPGPRVVAVGGGHGLAATIHAVRRYAGRTTALVATADDGGSTGRLRDAIDMPAPGDVRRCVEAMADPSGSPLLAALEHRFLGSDVEGHALGNLVLAGLHAVTGDFVAAVDELSRLVGVDPAAGRVLPVTVEPVALAAEVAGGRRVTGQVAVAGTVGVERVVVEPTTATPPDAAVEALLAADQVVLGPGSLYTSVLAAAVVGGVRDALAKAPGPRVYVCNLRAELAETRGYDIADHVAALRRHGVEPDIVLVQRAALCRSATWRPRWWRPTWPAPTAWPMTPCCSLRRSPASRPDGWRPSAPEQVVDRQFEPVEQGRGEPVTDAQIVVRVGRSGRRARADEDLLALRVDEPDLVDAHPVVVAPLADEVEPPRGRGQHLDDERRQAGERQRFVGG